MVALLEAEPIPQINEQTGVEWTGQMFDTTAVPTVRTRIELPSEEAAEHRIESAHKRARKEEVDGGLKWYVDAHDMCAEWVTDIRPDLTVRHAAGVLAALSPMQIWDRNIIEAKTMLQTGDCKALGYAKRDARQIADGTDPSDVLFDPKRNNRKVRSFFLNIADPSDPIPVTIDRHMIALLTNDPQILHKQSWISPDMYEWSAERFRVAAKKQNLLPLQLQAIVWNVWRRTHAGTPIKTYEDVALPF